MVDNPDDFNLVQCFFGEHLLPVYPDSKVMIVESEKSAIIASHYYPQYLWLASGGCCGCLNQTASQVLKGREVWLVPDLDAEDRWRANWLCFAPLPRLPELSLPYPIWQHRSREPPNLTSPTSFCMRQAGITPL